MTDPTNESAANNDDVQATQYLAHVNNGQMLRVTDPDVLQALAEAEFAYDMLEPLATSTGLVFEVGNIQSLAEAIVKHVLGVAGETAARSGQVPADQIPLHLDVEFIKAAGKELTALRDSDAKSTGDIDILAVRRHLEVDAAIHAAIRARTMVQF